MHHSSITYEIRQIMLQFTTSFHLVIQYHIISISSHSVSHNQLIFRNQFRGTLQNGNLSVFQLKHSNELTYYTTLFIKSITDPVHPKLYEANSSKIWFVPTIFERT
jgi:hypothetical protein